ncbi:MAG TPA: GNAT family N-acetyltransferase [Pirellulales bacterium]
MSQSLLIRPAVAADVAALGRLGAALARQHAEYDPGRYHLPADVEAAYRAQFVEHIGRAGSVVIVAESRSAVIGYAFGLIEQPCFVSLTGRAGWIHDLYVLPDARGLGAGGKLLDAAIAGLRAIGCPGGVLLAVAAQNAAGAALFQKRGFRPSLQEMTLGPWPEEGV